MSAITASSPEKSDEGVLLEIEPLVAPYLEKGPLTIRIERLPSRSRLSKGHNNGDGSYSLRPDELENVIFEPPADRDGTAVTLAVRVVKVDGGYASTLGMTDLPVLPGTEIKKPKRPEAALPPPPADDAEAEAPEAAVLTEQAIGRRNKAFGAAPQYDPVEFLKMQRAFDVLSKTLAEAEARAEHAERKANQAEARLAELDTGSGDRDIDAEKIREEVSEKYERELGELKQKFDTASRDFEHAHRQALESAEADHARELEETVAATTKQLATEFDARLATALREAETKAAAHVHDQRRAWEGEAQNSLAAARETWNREEAQRLDAAREAFESELAGLRDQLSAATDGIEAARKQAAEIAEANHAREIADLQAAHTRALEERVSAAVAGAESAAETRLAEVRREAEQTAERKLAEAKTAQESELAQLRQRLEAVTEELARVREHAAGDAERREDFALQERELAEVRAQLATANAEIETLRQPAASGAGQAAFADQQDKAFEARLAAERIAWKEEAGAEMAKARAAWKKAEEKNLAEALRGMQIDGKSGRGRRIPGGWSIRDRLPRRSLVIKVAIVALLALSIVNLDTRLFLLRHADPVLAEIERQAKPLLDRIVPLLTGQIAAVVAPQSDTLGEAESHAVVSVASANIRSGPSTSAGVVGSLPRGSAVAVLETQGNWWRVRFGAGRTGWIYQSLLETGAW